LKPCSFPQSVRFGCSALLPIRNYIILFTNCQALFGVNRRKGSDSKANALLTSGSTMCWQCGRFAANLSAIKICCTQLFLLHILLHISLTRPPK
jgi:hypothetical protein